MRQELMHALVVRRASPKHVLLIIVLGDVIALVVPTTVIGIVFVLGLEWECLTPLNIRNPMTSELPSHKKGRLKSKGKHKSSVQPWRVGLLNPLALPLRGTVGVETLFLFGADCCLSGICLAR